LGSLNALKPTILLCLQQPTHLQEATAQGIEFDVVTYGIDDLDRAITDGEDHGFIKVITPKGKDTILGATIVGTNAGDLLAFGNVIMLPKNY